jgi:hypothetical protein
MNQPPSGATGFREVDRDGNPLPHETGATEPPAWTPGARAALNPFIVVLWLFALGLIAGGAAAFFYGMGNQLSPNGQVPVSFLVLTNAPYAILLGIAALLCLLFWHALQWQKRRG